MRTRQDGELVEHGGRTGVRFVRTLPHPPEAVWAAVSTPEGMRHWFPSPEISFDPDPPQVGGTIRMSGDPYLPEGSTGRITAWQVPSRFTFEWDRDELSFAVAPSADGTQLALVDLLGTPGAAARNAAGWDQCLADLEGSLGDGAPTTSDDFLPLLEAYIAKGLPDDGWRPGDGNPPPN